MGPDERIEEQDFRGGVTVVDIGDLRVARGWTRRPHSSCEHRSLVYDNRERRIWCKDCERNVEAFDAFELLVGRYGAALESLKRRETALMAWRLPMKRDGGSQGSDGGGSTCR